MPSFKELAGSLGVERPHLDEGMSIGQMTALRLNYIEDVVAAALSHRPHGIPGLTGTVLDGLTVDGLTEIQRPE